MLWYKGWLETRYRLLFIVGFSVLFLSLQHSARSMTPPPGGRTAAYGLVMLGVPMLLLSASALLGGSGIVTQPSLQAAKGLHGSTLYTLSMPVNRFRLLAVRAGIGWLELAGVIALVCGGMWVVSPAFQALGTPMVMVQYAATLIACGSVLYCVSVLLATFLDDQWRTWGTMMVSAMLWWFSTRVPIPEAMNIFRAMREGSPVLTHTMPWAAMGFSVTLGAVLLFVAAKVVQKREY